MKSFHTSKKSRFSGSGDTIPNPNPITGTGPVLAALTDGDTLSSAVTWGSYLPGGATAERQMRVDGGAWVAYVGSTAVAEGEVWEVREVVSYLTFTRTYTSAAREVPATTDWIISGPMVLQSPVPPNQPTVSGSMIS